MEVPTDHAERNVPMVERSLTAALEERAVVPLHERRWPLCDWKRAKGAADLRELGIQEGVWLGHDEAGRGVVEREGETNDKQRRRREKQA
jgi:hypothetical protein